MPNWIDEQVQKRRFEDMVRMAQHDLLVNDMVAAPSQHLRFYRPVLAQLGRWLAAWGDHLQSRYGAAPEVAIATDSRGPGSRC